MVEKVLSWTTRAFNHKFIVIGITLAVTIFLGLGLPQLKTDTSARGMLPESNKDVALNDYYTSSDRFGNPDYIFIGVESPKLLSVETVKRIQTLTNTIETIAQGMPLTNAQSFFKLSAEEGKKLLDYVSTFAFNDSNYATELLPKLLDAAALAQNLGISPEKAKALVKDIKALQPSQAYDILRNPISDTQNLVNGDYVTNVDDTLTTQKLLDEGEITPEAVEKLKARLDSWSIYEGTLISKDKTMTGIILKLQVREEFATGAFIKILESLLQKENGPDFKTYITGEYVINDHQGRYMAEDLAILLPIVSLLLILAMAFFFRTWQGVVFPLLMVLVAVVGGTGFMAWMGVPLTIVSTAMPVILMAIACAYGIHQMNHYLTDVDTDKQAIFTRNMKNVGLALLLSGLATMIGFGALVADDFVPIKNFGFYTAIGNLIALGAVLYFLPTLMIATGKTKKSQLKEKKNGIVNLLLRGLVGLNRKSSGRILIGAGVLAIGFGIGCTLVVSQLNPINFFHPSDPVRIASDKISEKMAGIKTLNLVVDSDLRPVDKRQGVMETVVDIVQPEVLQKLEAFSVDVKKQFPDKVGKVMSFNDLIKKMNQEMNGGDPAYYKIPESKDLISQYLLMFSGDTASYMTSSNDKLNMAITLKDSTTRETETIRKYIINYFSEDWKKAHQLQTQVTGTAHLYTVANDLLVEGTVKAIQICIVVVFLLLLIVLRNLWMSLIAMIPIGITLVINFGVLGWFGIPFDAGTAMVSSVAIGIGVDFSIHFITWFRHELERTDDIGHALDESIMHKGRAILYNMFVIIAGFVVLATSRFVPLVEFGLLVSLCMVTTAFGSLVLVPAAVRFFGKRGFKFVYLGKKIAPKVQG